MSETAPAAPVTTARSASTSRPPAAAVSATAPPAPASGAIADPTKMPPEFEPYRRELTGYCYRMLGSSFEAEDAVQETLIRAWRAFERFEGRSTVRTWLYRIATNICLDMLNGSQRRARPMDLASPGTPEPNLVELPEATWVEPISDRQALPSASDPADVAVARDSIRLAFVAALQYLPPRQRAVLILREVLRWQASEVAELLETSVASVNSALQRARTTLAATNTSVTDPESELDDVHRALLDRYLDAFERYDMEALTALLHADVMLNMPPFDLWLRGRDDVLTWLVGPGAECRGSRMLPTAANGSPAFGQYRPSGPGGRHEPWALQTVEMSNGCIVAITAFLDTARLFPAFGLPERP